MSTGVATDGAHGPRYVLIHGGCHGAWCWADVQQLLAAAGVFSHAFDLPGCGADMTARAQVGFADQLAVSLRETSRFPDDDLVIVGHSIGGWLLPPIAAALAADSASGSSRNVELVFLAAAVLNHGETGLSVTPAQRQQPYRDMAAASPDNTLMVSFEDAWNRFFPSLPEDRARAAYAQLTPQPFAPYLHPSSAGVEEIETPRRYLLMTEDRTYPPSTARTFADKAGVEPVEIVGDHCVMLTDPVALVRALLNES